MLVIPAKFNKNAPDVRARGASADTGAALLGYMTQRIGLTDLSNTDLLDFGCGCRFAEAIDNKNIPIKSYTGLDIDLEMISFLQANAPAKMSFHHWNAHNPFYNAGGVPMTAESQLPVGDRTFDAMCMFSVITHQLPTDAEIILTILRRHIRPTGRLFFSVTIENVAGYAEEHPNMPTAHSFYSLALLTEILGRAGWRMQSMEARDPQGLPIQDSLVCAPA